MLNSEEGNNMIVSAADKISTEKGKYLLLDWPTFYALAIKGV